MIIMHYELQALPHTTLHVHWNVLSAPQVQISDPLTVCRSYILWHITIIPIYLNFSVTTRVRKREWDRL